MKIKKPTLKELHNVWADCVKARAGMKSEYSGKKKYLHAHHIHGKPNYRLRFELANGVCITSGEHKFIAHNTWRSEEFKTWAVNLRSFPTQTAKIYVRNHIKTDLVLLKKYLELKLREFQAVNRFSG